MRVLPYSSVNSIIALFCFSVFALISHGRDDACNRKFSCGRLIDFSYPFWRDGLRICGQEGFKIDCRDDIPIITTIHGDYIVLSINQTEKVMTIVRNDYQETVCPHVFSNITLNWDLFNLSPGFQNLSFFYNCPFQLPTSPIPESNRFRCPPYGSQPPNAFYATEALLSDWELTSKVTECERVDIPVPSDFLVDISGVMAVMDVLKRGFNVSYENHVACQAEHLWCPDADTPNVRGEVGTGILGALGVIGILIIICFKRTFLGEVKMKNQDFEAILNSYGPLSIKRYSFSQVKQITHNFKVKLGQGGYGSVYRGKLFDGHLVAVKVLNASKGSKGEEFINEVASISKTSHVNIVTLLGFCLEGEKRVLIYEFMPNGSLDKFICYESTSKPHHDQHLEWEVMHQITIGIARGLEYLHRGCNTRIVHFDIKPHNILLDENFCPKISDFGLAKLCTKIESIVSMLEARGTIGYIAPEVFNRCFGKVSYKSDVYSYGMMVLEVIGGRKIDHVVTTDDASGTYFPYWIYERLELDDMSELYGEISMEETEIVRKMTMVGLWCIQTNPTDRPSMNKVLEMLQGSIESLKIPPKPFISSPPRSPPLCSSTISISIE